MRRYADARMSLIHIARNNTTLGQFTEAEVRAGLSDGTYRASDLAWKAGLKDWRPLGSWPEFGGEAPPPMPSGVHRGGEELMPQPAAAQQKLVDMPSWEREDAGSAPARMLASIREVMLAPAATFKAMPVTGGFGRPFSFYIVAQLLNALLMAAGMAALVGTMGDTLAETPQYAPLAKMGAGGAALVYFALYAIAAPLGLFIWSFIQHALLKMWGAEGADHEATFRVLAYTHGAAAFIALPFNLLGLIPVVGALFSMIAMLIGIWAIVVQILAFVETHRISGGKAAGAVLCPMILCCCLIGFGGFAAVAAIAGAHR